MACDWGPLCPADKFIQEVADKVKCTLEERVGRKFEIYKALTYRQSPYIPSPPGGGPGPQLNEVDYLIKVETIPETQSYHIVVEVNYKTQTYTLLAYFPDLDLHAPLDKFCVLGSGGTLR